MASGGEVKRAYCGCCGLWVDCTIEYIGWVQEQFGGIWVCGLCEEAIKYEQARLGVGVEIAIKVHSLFRETASIDPTLCIARSILQLIRKIMSSSSSSSSPPSNFSSLS